MKSLPAPAALITHAHLAGPEAALLVVLILALATLALTGTPVPDALTVVATAASTGLLTRRHPGGNQLDGRGR
ncbi:hypothetical protein DR950_33835 [Kitasatospora xanthocidica]|uniref:Uncharacterized protein n=1 Tax=Kitasatospora xanthocidica TaxID=83382 RepID=A0A373A3B6_9ACTN|nr:hypothetical protein [Kitasatospora xanthocidica]RGD62067.1 hypothetical protein DR950_33835 [Kitasatospora xanthocidica]